MPPRAPLRRSFTALIGAWIVLFSAVAPVAVPCPMAHAAPGANEASPNAAQTPGAHAFGTHAVGTHAGHAASGGPAGAPTPADTPAPFHQCDCVTTCCSAPTAALPGLPASVASVTIAPSTQARAEAPLVRAASRTRLLPFAQAPPA